MFQALEDLNGVNNIKFGWMDVQLCVYNMTYFFPTVISNLQLQHPWLLCRVSIKQAVREPPQYAPPLSSLCGHHRTDAPRAAKPIAPDHKVSADSHGEYVPTVTAAAAWSVNGAVIKAAWWP